MASGERSFSNCGRDCQPYSPHRCKYCGGSFCPDHRLPENHGCLEYADLLGRGQVGQARFEPGVTSLLGGSRPVTDHEKELMWERVKKRIAEKKRIRESNRLYQKRIQQIKKLMIISVVVFLFGKAAFSGIPSQYLPGPLKEYQKKVIEAEWLKDYNEAKEAFDQLNDIRAKYGREPIKWDDNLYQLAVFRSKDMYARDYYDHKTPDGKCAGDYAPLFNVSNTNIAENIHGIVTPSAAIRDWMRSRGHRYNLLYPNHIKGALGCAAGGCVFLASSSRRDIGWKCSSAKEGRAAWKNAPRKPYEVDYFG